MCSATRSGYVPLEVYGWVEKVDFGKLPGEVLRRVSSTSLITDPSIASAYRTRVEEEEEQGEEETSKQQQADTPAATHHTY